MSLIWTQTRETEVSMQVDHLAIVCGFNVDKIDAGTCQGSQAAMFIAMYHTKAPIGHTDESQY